MSLDNSHKCHWQSHASISSLKLLAEYIFTHFPIVWSWQIDPTGYHIDLPPHRSCGQVAFGKVYRVVFIIIVVFTNTNLKGYCSWQILVCQTSQYAEAMHCLYAAEMTLLDICLWRVRERYSSIWSVACTAALAAIFNYCDLHTHMLCRQEKYEAFQGGLQHGGRMGTLGSDLISSPALISRYVTVQHCWTWALEDVPLIMSTKEKKSSKPQQMKIKLGDNRKLGRSLVLSSVVACCSSSPSAVLLEWVLRVMARGKLQVEYSIQGCFAKLLEQRHSVLSCSSCTFHSAA